MKVARGYVANAGVALALTGLPAAACAALGATTAAWALAGVAGFLVLFLAFFFRDPNRSPPADDGVVVSGADGVVSLITELEHPLLPGRLTRISVFLSVFDVHVNRAPAAGTVRHLAYVPGRKIWAFMDQASEVNEHSTILIENPRFTCLVKQIVGPVARRVIYWLEVGQRLAQGERIGMMKFGSRMDVYLPADRFALCVRKGDRVVAGETVMARLKEIS